MGEKRFLLRTSARARASRRARIAMSDSFIVVTEEGFGKHSVLRHTHEGAARDAAAKLWCCWVLYRSTNDGTVLIELGTGGVGFSHGNIRNYAESSIKSKARDTGARAGAAAAAEARAAAAAKAAPKPKSRPAPTADGRLDVSNPVAWD